MPDIRTDRSNSHWKPLAPDKLDEIAALFNRIYPQAQYGDLAPQASALWTGMLRQVWDQKPQALRRLDEAYRPDDPLSRIQQKTVVIAYADSVSQAGEPTLNTLERCLQTYFPAVGGLHMLPACKVAENRFNDGYFSQVRRDQIHPEFGTNDQFSAMMARFFSMTDFVLNHVDIDNPMFQAYLDGDDAARECFFVFDQDQYQAHLKAGDFDAIFRPRPFPLFTIFRRRPVDEHFRGLSQAQKVTELNNRMPGGPLPEPLVSLLSIFNPIRNDQMLLEGDYAIIEAFRRHLEQETQIRPNDIFTVSATQETQHVPYIFQPDIQTRADLLKALGYADQAGELARDYDRLDPVIFGAEIRALTTFSHVQVDLNTATLPGLQLLAQDFAWYLGMDLNMLRLDAANFAFKRWQTPCFGLDEVRSLMKILYLSMDCVAPRMVANLEVNDQLGRVLTQMADKTAPPPMMYDFHLASMLPVVFNTGQPEILARIFEMIRRFDIPRDSIRFSLAESHDGKSVRGSLDLLTLAERQGIADVVEENGGRIKYKAVAPGRFSYGEFQDVCREADLDARAALAAVFKAPDAPQADTLLTLKPGIKQPADLARAIGRPVADLTGNPALKFFTNKLLGGREPYELCAATRDALVRLADPSLEPERYLGFYTLALALMGRNVKSIYFNDLLALPNDYHRFKSTGELRDLKRTKVDYGRLQQLLNDPRGFHARIAKGINNLIALVDADPALHPRGNEAEVLIGAATANTAVIRNRRDRAWSLTIVNTSAEPANVDMDLSYQTLAQTQALVDHISGKHLPLSPERRLTASLEPFERLWLTEAPIEIPAESLIA